MGECNIRANAVYTGDNLHVLNGMNSDCVDLIYLDPPFNANRVFAAPIGSRAAGATFKDMWSWKDVDDACLHRLFDNHPRLVQYIASIEHLHSRAMMAYVTYMTQRIMELHRVLNSTGSLYLHCDTTASHYLKPVMDVIFGRQNFINEIIWHYSKWTNAPRHFQKNHDVLFLYGKSAARTFNKQYFTSDNKQRTLDRGYHTNRINGVTQLLVYDREKAGRKIAEGNYDRLVDCSKQSRGTPMPDVWTDINLINSQAKERVGYPTQKPLALLRRIIESSSNEGELVLDPFCGCATAMVAAGYAHRKWIGIDVSRKAAEMVHERLAEDAEVFGDFTHVVPDEKTGQGLPKRTDVRCTAGTDKDIRKHLYSEQDGCCNGCMREFDVYDMEVDHILPLDKGGGDYYENYQLLCSNCNRIKGNRPMDFLIERINRRNKAMSLVSFGF